MNGCFNLMCSTFTKCEEFDNVLTFSIRICFGKISKGFFAQDTSHVSYSYFAHGHSFQNAAKDTANFMLSWKEQMEQNMWLTNRLRSREWPEYSKTPIQGM